MAAFPLDTVEKHAGTCKHRSEASGRRALGSPAFHLAVVILLRYFPLVSCGAVAVRVQLDFSLGPSFAASVTGIFVQIIIIVLVVVRFLKRHEPFHVCRHLGAGRKQHFPPGGPRSE